MLGNDKLQRLLLALADGRWCSGEVLAERLAINGEAVSRMTINNYAKQLIEAGYPLERKHGLGYRLDADMALLDADALTAMLQTPVAVAALTESTNNDAAQWLRDNVGGQAVVFAAGFQTQGRGRLNRKWQARPGDALLCSLAWRFQHYPPDLPALSLVVALCLVESLRDLNVESRRLKIKWPNDVLLDGKKLAGILIEASLQHEQVSAVIGMGMNIKRAPQDDLRYPAVCLADAGIDCAAEVLLSVWAQRLQNMLASFAATGFGSFYDAFMRYDAVVGMPLQIDDEPLTVSGIDKTGALEVIQQGQVKRYVSGEVSLPWPSC